MSHSVVAESQDESRRSPFFRPQFVSALEKHAGSLSGLFYRLLRPVSAVPSAVPEGMRIYAVGDIHGRADLLDELHAMIEADASTARAGCRCTIVYVGDYVDRGPDSKGVIERLIAPDRLPGFDAVYLRGNHEDALLSFLDEATVGPAWFAIGGGATALSYGVGFSDQLPGKERFARIQEDLRARIPPEHLRFLAGLRLSYRAGDYFFVHAGVKPGRPLEEQDRTDLLNIRKEFLRSRRYHGAVVVHGHSARPGVEFRANRIGIDTCAYATGHLTCLVLEGTSRRLLKT